MSSWKPWNILFDQDKISPVAVAAILRAKGWNFMGDLNACAQLVRGK